MNWWILVYGIPSKATVDNHQPTHQGFLTTNVPADPFSRGCYTFQNRQQSPEKMIKCQHPRGQNQLPNTSSQWWRDTFGNSRRRVTVTASAIEWLWHRQYLDVFVHEKCTIRIIVSSSTWIMLGSWLNYNSPTTTTHPTHLQISQIFLCFEHLRDSWSSQWDDYVDGPKAVFNFWLGGVHMQMVLSYYLLPIVACQLGGRLFFFWVLPKIAKKETHVP